MERRTMAMLIGGQGRLVLTEVVGAWSRLRAELKKERELAEAEREKLAFVEALRRLWEESRLQIAGSISFFEPHDKILFTTRLSLVMHMQTQVSCVANVVFICQLGSTFDPAPVELNTNHRFALSLIVSVFVFGRT